MLLCPGCGEENPPKFRLCGFCGAALSGAPLPVHEMRKTVTIVFSDLKDSTALGERIDTEALHEVKERYFATMAAEIARHGGKVEKYIGDAIMAVFGLPKAHEDDALRAVRAANGMRAALEELNHDLRFRYGVMLANRTGINTGEVVANADPTADQKLATGDTVNVAARLEQAAPPGEIYLGAATWALVRDAVEVEAVEPLALKGKNERVAAYRLLSAAGLDGNARRLDTPLAGRDEELATLDTAWRSVCAGRAVRLVTVIGDAGVGKSRLVQEAIHRRADDATVLSGRCLPYGNGITFWPLVEMVRALIHADASPQLARQRLVDLVGDADVADRIEAAIGLSTAVFPLHELFWAARRLFQCLAQERPVIALIDDLHWAEPAFLELIEHVLDAAADAPILLLATARHDLVEERPTWPDRPGASRLMLRPLSAAAAESVIASLLGSAPLAPALVKRIVEAAEGNPLYVEQMLSMLNDSRECQADDESNGLAGMAGLTEDADEQLVVPPTIHALIEARLDRLGRDERATVDPAAVAGVRFPRAAVESLVPQALRDAVPRHLAALYDRQFLDPVASRGAADRGAAFRFHHQLIRDTVYGGLLKRTRANLHVAYVRWADQLKVERERSLDFEVILGYHLEQAHRYLCELGPLDAKGVEIGVDAAHRLSVAGRRAFSRGDMRAAANLYRRAVALLGEQAPNRLELLSELGEVLLELGDFAQARTVLADAQAAAERAGNQCVAALAQLLTMRVRLYSAESGDWSDEALRMATEAIPLFESVGAHRELARAWRLIGLVHGIAARYGQSSDAVSRSIAHAKLAGDERLITRNSTGLASSTLLGPTPVPQAIERCEQMIAGGFSDRQAQAKILCALAQLRAMNGEFDQARALYRQGRNLLRELGQGLNAASTGIDILLVESLAGDLVAAEREVMPDYEFLVRAGETYFMSTMASLLSRVVRDQGRDDEAMTFSKIAEGATAADDMESQALWRSIRAPIIARTGNWVEAESLARSAVELSRKSDAPQMQADTLFELATVLMLAGRPGEARLSNDEATAIYCAKGDIVSAARSAARSARLG